MKKIGFILLVLIVAVLMVFFIIRDRDSGIIGEQRIIELSGDDRTTESIAELKELNNSSYNEEEAIGHFIKMGFSWKSIADVTKDNQDYQYAIEAYKKAEDLAGDTNILPINNIGLIYEILGDYALAEEQYLRALDISPAEFDTNKRLFDLYRYKLDKSPEEIIGLLDRALARAVEKAPLLQLKAGYLKDTGDYQGALDIYESLVDNYPQFQVFIDELEDKLK
ncbi:hypothetical protein KKH39_04725 [Patescibacteria group bacterium]|nr:hypothetical protein [Patescibacteria group bacterium]